MFYGNYFRITNFTRLYILKNFIKDKKQYTVPCLCHIHNIQPFSRTASPLCSKYTENMTVVNEHKFSRPIKSKMKIRQNIDSSSISAEELLEKLIAGLSGDIHQKNRVYKNDLLRVINKVKEMNFSTKKQGLLLLRCCTELLPDEAPSTRMDLVEQIWNTIKLHTKFEVEHYNELLRVYIANNRTLTVNSFISQMRPVKPNMTTYELILKALGEIGDLNQATEVISNMKSQNLPATESIFNSLIICQGKIGNIHNIQEILTMMKSLKLEPSINTYTAIVRALAWNKLEKHMIEELNKAQHSGLQFGQEQIMDITKTLAIVGLYSSIPKVLQYLPEEILNTPSITPYMQSTCTWLVFQNHPLPALEVYKCLPLPSFGPMDDQGLHGRSLVRDCVKASVPSSVIGLIAQELMASGRNSIAIQNAAEAALQLGKELLALDMFTRMQQLGMPVRPHYFWPILLQSSKSYGEKGIMNTLSKMIKMDVKPDYETIMLYTLPYVSFTSPQNLMKKFMEAGLSITTVLTPMMETLLNMGQVRAASEICELFQGKVDVEKIQKPLLKAYLTTGDIESTVNILEDSLKKPMEKKDWIGRFLCVFMQHKKVKEDLTDFMNLAKTLQAKKFKISIAAADYCMTNLSDKYSETTIDTFRDTLINLTDEGLIDEGEMFTQQMPHPKHMNEESLKAHLNELEAKGMNTRGVLRRLLQQYCRDGNMKAAREIADKCQKEGVFLSAGMKAAIFDLHVKLGELELAEIMLADLNKTSPNFTLDEHKVIDFATLMVYKKKINEAVDMINEQSKRRRIVGGRGIEMNCWRLLDTTAAQGSHLEVKRMFDLLTSLRYCKPTNSLLGPLVKVHLKNNNLQEAVHEFTLLANKYNKTPLKHELLCNILLAMGEGQSEENFLTNEKLNDRFNKMVQTVLNTDKKVHGAGDVQLTLIAALAEVGYKKSLRKMFLDPSVKFHPAALLRRCERFADEKKVHALEAIAQCTRDLRHADVRDIYDLILDVYSRNENCKDAYALWNRMQELDVQPSQKFVRNLCSLFKANNKEVPADLSLYLNKQTKKATSS